MANFTIVGDPHCKVNNIEKIKSVFSMVETLQNPIILLGDLLDTKSMVRSQCLNLYVELISKSSLTFYILVGNHDLHNLSTTEHSLTPLKLLKNVIMVETPMDFSGTPFYMIPYVHDQSELKEALKQGPQNSVLIGHLELKGFDFGTGRICSEGLTSRAFKQYKRVISGHFHKFQEQDSITYLGTPFSHSFGESNQEKYIATYDTDLDKLTLIKTNLPEHRTVEFNCDNLNDTKDHVIIPFEEDASKHYYRVILTGEQKNIDRFPKDMYKTGNLNIRFLERPSNNVCNDITLEETASNQVQFQKWATDIKKLDPETVKLGLDILGAASVK